MELNIGPGDGFSSIVSPPIETIETDLLCSLRSELGALETVSGVFGVRARGKPLEVLSDSDGLCDLVFG